ncbi:MarP family serine protease [Luteococcus sp. OSA5]|uniref:MarP family serine protease n=1 Tax=Luteococcus sp. OSA5 TaxID=3401630 RepID=UPI003B43A559
MTDHTWLDLALALALLLQAARGWRLGALTSISGLVGLLGGAVLGLWAAPQLVDRFGSHLEEPLPAILVVGGVLLTAVFGEALVGGLGHRLRLRTRDLTAQRLDQVLGAVASMVVFSTTVTLLGGAVRPVLPQSWAATMNRSAVLPWMDAVTPDQAGRFTQQFTQRLGDVGFPRVFSGLAPEPVLPVPEPDGSLADSQAVARASASIVRISSSGERCERGSSGSGWVVAGNRVVTNAHVVAGGTDIRVQVAGRGPRLQATPVAFDPDLDLAVLDVPRLQAPALARAGQQAKGDGVVVAGFPQGEGYTLRAARVRGIVEAEGDDIYGGGGVRRQVYSLAGDVRRGNSGGPLLTPEGTVAGTIFARSMVDPKTGYALTDKATDDLLDQAASLQTPVSTQGCARA